MSIKGGERHLSIIECGESEDDNIDVDGTVSEFPTVPVVARTGGECALVLTVVIVAVTLSNNRKPNAGPNGEYNGDTLNTKHQDAICSVCYKYIHV